MMRLKLVDRRLAAALLGTLVLTAATAAKAEEDMFDGNWRFSVTPYLWLPNVNGSATFDRGIVGGHSLDSEVGPNSYLSNLKFAFMITGEARKGQWSAFTDYIYLNFSDQRSTVHSVNNPAGSRQVPIDLGSTSSIRGDVWTLAGSYTAWREGATHVDVFAGFRYLGLDTSLDWNLLGPLGLLNPSGSASLNWSKWDGIAGVKGQVRFGETRWFMPYYIDIGTGSGNWTWQALVGVGYRYGWGAITLSVRSLSYDFDDHNADVRFTGPALGATFVF